MITGINESKALKKHTSCGRKCMKLTEDNLLQINGGATVNVDVKVKNIIYMNKNMFLVNVFVKMESI